jgi:hypothetical protein
VMPGLDPTLCDCGVAFGEAGSAQVAETLA